MGDDHRNDPAATLVELQRQLKEQQQRAASSPANKPYPPQFTELCREYVLRDTWTVAETALLVNACHPKRLTPLAGGPPEIDSAIRETEALLISCLGESLPVIGSMPKLFKSKARLRVADFNSLTNQRSLTIPRPLDEALNARFGEAEKKPVHGNALRNEKLRNAAREAADHFVTEKPAKFVKPNGAIDRTALAAHLEAYPAAWVPESMVDPEAASPLNSRTLRELLGQHFREAGK